MTEDESRHALEYPDKYIIEPEFHWWNFENWKNGKRLPENFRYSSESNTVWLKDEELLEMIQDISQHMNLPIPEKIGS